MATIKYKDADGNLITVGAGPHTHDGIYYTESEIDTKLDTLIGDKPVSEQISDHAGITASQSAPGHMSKEDKSKLDGIATGANKYSLPTASSSTLGGIKVGTGLSISSGKLSVSKPLPTVTTSNNGQFLRVVDGAWVAVTIKTAESEAL